jgi:hypothetical protein
LKNNEQGKILIKGKTLKEIRSIVLVVLVVFGFTGNYFYQSHLANQRKQEQISALKIEINAYERKYLTCINPIDQFNISFNNNARSEPRISEVMDKYQKIIEAPCVILRNESIYSNPYQGISINSIFNETRTPQQEELYQGILFDVDRGVPFLRTGGSICSDGWISGSVGRGTCSWHGGYARQRGNDFKFNFSVIEDDPRLALQELMK